MARRNPYEPESVEPHIYDPDEPVELAAVAKLCDRSMAWVEARLGNYPGVMARSSDNHRWVRREDVAEWIRLSDLERVELRGPNAGVW